MPDSDQCVRRQQRPWFGALFVAMAAALLLAGCLGNPGRPDAASSGGEITVTSDAVAATPAEPATEAGQAPAATTLPVAEQPDRVVWERLRNGFRFSRLEHPRIDQEIARLQRSPNAFRALMARSEPFIHHILNRIEQAGMPTELALLPAVESGFQPHVYSPNGAAGLWQFMPATGNMLGLGQDWWFDRRRTVLQSTNAAIIYLDELYRRFDRNWMHALAAYNAGAGTLNRAIRQAARRGEPTDFWSLDLPGETDRYIPRLLAVARVVADPDAYGLDLPEIDDKPYFTMVDTGGQIDLHVAAELAGMSTDELFTLNAGHKRWASHPDGPHVLLLPLDRADAFTAALAALPPEQRLRWRRHLIRSGDNLGRIALQYGVSVDAIQRTNGLEDTRIRAGRHLLIPLSDSVNETVTASNQTARQRMRYRVRKGDSLYAIAQRFQVSVADLKRWNRVGRYIQPGERLTLYIDPDV